MTTAEQLRARGFIEGRSKAESKDAPRARRRPGIAADEHAHPQIRHPRQGAHDLVAGATEEQIIRWSSRLVEGAATLDDVFGR